MNDDTFRIFQLVTLGAMIFTAGFFAADAAALLSMAKATNMLRDEEVNESD